MYRPLDRTPAYRPAWHRDAKWLSGALLALVVTFGLWVFALYDLSSPEPAKALFGEILRLELLPEDAPSVTQGRVPLLPGVAASAELRELPDLHAEAAAERIAAALADALVERGRTGALELVTAEPLRTQLESLLSTTAPVLVQARLSAALAPFGLADVVQVGADPTDGARLGEALERADADLGVEVQPIAELRVTVPFAALRGLEPHAIVEQILARLTDLALVGGVEAVRAVTDNPGLRDLLGDAVAREARADLRTLFATLLISQHERLAEHLAAAEAEGRLLAMAALGASPPRTRAAALAALSERVYRDGPEALEPHLTQPARALLGALSAEAHQRYARLLGILAVAAVVLVLLLLWFSEGVGGVRNLGLALIFGAGWGAAAYLLLARGRSVALELAARERGGGVGAFGRLRAALVELGSSIPDTALTLFARPHALALLMGVLLVALYLVTRLIMALAGGRVAR